MDWDNICSFPLVRKCTSSQKVLKYQSNWMTELAQSLLILTKILSWPCALFLFEALILLIISDSVNVIE